LSVVSGQWSVVNGQWSMVSGQWSVVFGFWSLVLGFWSLNSKGNHGQRPKAKDQKQLTTDY